MSSNTQPGRARASRNVYGSQAHSSPARSRQPLAGRIVYRCFWVVVWSLVKSVCRLRVEGGERLPSGPFIL